MYLETVLTKQVRNWTRLEPQPQASQLRPNITDQRSDLEFLSWEYSHTAHTTGYLYVHLQVCCI